LIFFEAFLYRSPAVNRSSLATSSKPLIPLR
jgi:hypothetical protein